MALANGWANVQRKKKTITTASLKRPKRTDLVRHRQPSLMTIMCTRDEQWTRKFFNHFTRYGSISEYAELRLRLADCCCLLVQNRHHMVNQFFLLCSDHRAFDHIRYAVDVYRETGTIETNAFTAHTIYVINLKFFLGLLKYLWPFRFVVEFDFLLPQTRESERANSKAKSKCEHRPVRWKNPQFDTHSLRCEWTMMMMAMAMAMEMETTIDDDDEDESNEWQEYYERTCWMIESDVYRIENDISRK